MSANCANCGRLIQQDGLCDACLNLANSCTTSDRFTVMLDEINNSPFLKKWRKMQEELQKSPIFKWMEDFDKGIPRRRALASQLRFKRSHSNVNAPALVDMHQAPKVDNTPVVLPTPQTEQAQAPVAQNVAKPVEEPFDPLPKAGIKKMFRVERDEEANSREWDKWFHKPKVYGLDEARGPKKGTYYPDRVGNWLVDKGRLTRSHVNRILVKELPPRSERLREMYFLD